jgi:hypothetical protein
MPRVIPDYGLPGMKRSRLFIFHISKSMERRTHESAHQQCQNWLNLSKFFHFQLEDIDELYGRMYAAETGVGLALPPSPNHNISVLREKLSEEVRNYLSATCSIISELATYSF